MVRQLSHRLGQKVRDFRGGFVLVHRDLLVHRGHPFGQRSSTNRFLHPMSGDETEHLSPTFSNRSDTKPSSTLDAASIMPATFA